ncbi:MAG: 4Fe-4S binding protein [Thermaerobacter sp.]|nr:4Fe-4S binding protein [Thermaerobacter sp.]
MREEIMMVAGETMLLIDQSRCVGCHACETACKMENNVPPGPRWMEVVEHESVDAAGDVALSFLPLNCRHCADAPCVAVCPTQALARDGLGLVRLERERCIGCGECLFVCPFGAPQFGEDRLMQKCHGCRERRARNLPTACAQYCPSGALRCATPRELSHLVRTSRAALGAARAD